MLVNMYIPAENSQLCIVDGSAIASERTEDDWVKCYYEGNVYNACNLHKFEERVKVASYRLKHKAPTTAFEVFNRKALILVGRYDLVRDKFEFDKPIQLQQWISKYNANNDRNMLPINRSIGNQTGMLD